MVFVPFHFPVETAAAHHALSQHDPVDFTRHHFVGAAPYGPVSHQYGDWGSAGSQYTAAFRAAATTLPTISSVGGYPANPPLFGVEEEGDALPDALNNTIPARSSHAVSPRVPAPHESPPPRPSSVVSEQGSENELSIWQNIKNWFKAIFEKFKNLFSSKKDKFGKDNPSVDFSARPTQVARQEVKLSPRVLGPEVQASTPRKVESPRL